MLSGDLKYLELLKRSYPLIKAHDLEIGKKTYQNLFAAHPEVEILFTNTSPGQAQKFIDAILFYCTKADNFNIFYNRLDKIAHAHSNAGIKNEYYPHMKNAFLDALRSTLKKDATDELLRTWSYGFDRLSYELIHIENLLRKYES